MAVNFNPTTPHLSRRQFVATCAILPFLANFPFEETFVNSVKGQIKASQLGMTLIHEHVLVELWPN